MEQRSLQEKSDNELMELACRDNREAFEALGRAGTGDIGGHAPGTPGDAAGCGDVLMDEPTEAHKGRAGMLMYKDASKWSRSLLVRIVNASEI